MAVQYINRRRQTYYLHKGKTQAGKPMYFFSLKGEGELADTIPSGFEVYENPNGQVLLRRIQPKIITDSEIAVVKQGVQQFSRLQYYLVDVKQNIITIFTAEPGPDSLEDILSFGARDLLARSMPYTAMLRFILIDEEKRTFTTQRYCFRGSIDDWIDIGDPGTLEDLVKTYVKHLGQDSFYELARY